MNELIVKECETCRYNIYTNDTSISECGDCSDWLVKVDLARGKDFTVQMIYETS